MDSPDPIIEVYRSSSIEKLNAINDAEYIKAVDDGYIYRSDIEEWKGGWKLTVRKYKKDTFVWEK